MFILIAITVATIVIATIATVWEYRYSAERSEFELFDAIGYWIICAFISLLAMSIAWGAIALAIYTTGGN